MFNKIISDIFNHIYYCLVGSYLDYFFTFQTSSVDEQDLYDLLLLVITTSDNVKDVVKLSHLGCPLIPTGNTEVPALRLSIDRDRPRITTALIALGADIHFRLNQLNLVQYTWRAEGTTVFIKMIITRV